MPDPASVRRLCGRTQRRSFHESGYLGSTLDNPGAQAVIQAVRDGKVDTILVTDRDRLNKGIPLEELQNLPVIALAEEEQREKREAGREL